MRSGPARRLFAAGSLLALALLLAGCWGEPATGPVKVRFDRDWCELCRMIISDPRFAAQVRGGPKHKAFKFDDIGDAIHWLKMQDWKDDPKIEFYVMDMDKGKTWLDARKVWYVPGLHTPMEYGFGAIPDKRAGAVSFDEMEKTILERPPSRCLPPDAYKKVKEHQHE